jgi:hypothetical protein
MLRTHNQQLQGVPCRLRTHNEQLQGVPCMLRTHNEQLHGVPCMLRTHNEQLQRGPLPPSHRRYGNLDSPCSVPDTLVFRISLGFHSATGL